MISAPTPAQIEAQRLLKDPEAIEQQFFGRDTPIAVETDKRQIWTEDKPVAEALLALVEKHASPGQSVVLVPVDEGFGIQAPREVFIRARAATQGVAKS